MSKVANIQFASTGAVHGMTDGVRTSITMITTITTRKRDGSG